LRTIVVSDIHACPDLITNAIAEAGGHDRLVIAGDMLDIGYEPELTLELADRHADTVLLGNHEVAALLGIHIKPQDPTSFSYANMLAERLDEGWGIVTVVDDYLVSHAGVSLMQQSRLDRLGHDLHAFADELNEEFREQVRAIRALERMPKGSIAVDDWGPLWFRPLTTAPHGVLRNVKQIVGHTPHEHYSIEERESLLAFDIYLIDPYSRDKCMTPNWFRYALVEDGEISVHEGFTAVGAFR
jgi:hypothetical protein